DRLRRMVAGEMARLFDTVDLLIVPSLRDEMLTISNHTGHPSLTLRAGFIDVGQARSDWAPDPNHPMPAFNPKRRVPHGITLIGRLFDEGLLGRVGIALERAFVVADERPPGILGGRVHLFPSPLRRGKSERRAGGHFGRPFSPDAYAARLERFSEVAHR